MSGISVFLSYPVPFSEKQEKFIEQINAFLNKRGLCTRTLGVTDYDMEAPLVAIRRLMLESNGLITIAFRRIKIEKAINKPKSESESEIKDKWLSSPYCQIEPAMAFQQGLPLLIFREKGVIDDGILEKGVVGMYMPEFDLDNDIDKYLSSQEWNQLIHKWDMMVKQVYYNKGLPPKLY